MSTMTLTQSAAPTKVTARRPATVRRESNVRAAIMPLVSGLLLVLAVLVGVGVLSAAVAVILAGDSAVATTLVGVAGIALVGTGCLVAIRSRSY
ncbi:hypothetical protein [Actinomyces haliotis]|uniref:hypothetical protein n=1 Tax=Actinomyces haliotis TaxID=1280843 RepID=UPI00188E801B|nr:hypothetical protein [Actinomyces haliotis]